jgi:hypothetical protein
LLQGEEIRVSKKVRGEQKENAVDYKDIGTKRCINCQRFCSATIKLDIGTDRHNDILVGCATTGFALGSILNLFR